MGSGDFKIIGSQSTIDEDHAKEQDLGYSYMVTCSVNSFIISWHRNDGHFDNTQYTAGTMVVHDTHPLVFANAITGMVKNSEDCDKHRTPEYCNLDGLRIERKGNLLSITQDNIRVLYFSGVGILSGAMKVLYREWVKWCGRNDVDPYDGI